MAPANVRISPLGLFLIAVTSLGLILYAFGGLSLFSKGQSVNLREVLSASIDLAQKGGVKVKSIRESPEYAEKVKGKTDEGANEMLTGGDLASHREMVYGFAKAFPLLKVVSEEHENKAVDFRTILDPVINSNEVADLAGNEMVPVEDIAIWIDPLDATQEYTENLRQYVTTMVCVAVKGRPVIGVIHKPFSGETYWGWVGHGKSSNLTPSETKGKSSDPSKIIVSRSHSGTVESVVKEALGKETEVIPAGGAGYKTLEVISGKADAYVHVTKIKKWDICAGDAILTAMGGEMTTMANKHIDYSNTDDPLNDHGLLATMSKHKTYLKALEPAYTQDHKG